MWINLYSFFFECVLLAMFAQEKTFTASPIIFFPSNFHIARMCDLSVKHMCVILAIYTFILDWVRWLGLGGELFVWFLVYLVENIAVKRAHKIFRSQGWRFVKCLRSMIFYWLELWVNSSSYICFYNLLIINRTYIRDKVNK